ncbi:SDR family NAD(P)-dependent oxidoreductase [Stenotrophobium rhamnosiphilum]|uniref:SDR family oxidoreductase n=1 Tax=Stenotrophobium rhamnosiphilum TaxID=2029166 RepID=A0A2T5MJ71_9GAMM|nr:SDR family oxidoreductase [Stenotrophobium rhamnosiphilum]PTU32620.1 SDR family oxidoreductase [Stenotrophobium rhamnosiphilum]
MTQAQNKGFALITGASTGIGATYADRLAKRGYGLILVARDLQRLEQLAGKLRQQSGVPVEVIQADLTVAADLARVEQQLRENSQITMLVNNAGVAMSGELIDADPAVLEKMIQLNITAPSRLALAALAGFVARKAGSLINISSVLALAPEMFNGAYSGTKAYVLNLTLKLQQELAGKGVQVQAVLPGATRTEIWERSGTGIHNLPQEILMDVDEMVDAALSGYDQGEVVTIPSLPNIEDWNNATAARLKLGPNLSRNQAAARYKN